jgi:hypothetical protein
MRTTKVPVTALVGGLLLAPPTLGHAQPGTRAFSPRKKGVALGALSAPASLMSA